MAERSKAPDSRFTNLPIGQWERAFWSLNGGVGSNPTPDTITFSYFLFQCCQREVKELVANICDLADVFSGGQINLPAKGVREGQIDTLEYDNSR